MTKAIRSPNVEGRSGVQERIHHSGLGIAFVDSLNGLATLAWDDGPLAVAKRLECVRLQRRFPKAGCGVDGRALGNVRSRKESPVGEFGPTARHILVWCLRNNDTFAAMDFGRRLGARCFRTGTRGISRS